MPQVKFDFFQIQIAQSSPISFLQALDDILNLATEDRDFMIDGIKCFITDKKSIKGNDAYLLTKMRMDALPPKTKLDGTRTPLDLEEDEGLGEEMAMSYNSSLGYVAVHRNRHSISISGIAKMLQHYSPELGARFVPVLKKDALKRFSQYNTLKKLRIKLAGTTDFSFLRDSDLSANEKITIQEMLSEPYVDLTFSVGRKNVGLTDKVRNLVDCLTGFYKNGGENTVLAIEVTGKEDDHGETTFIDLLEDRLIHLDDVSLSGRYVNPDHLLRIACHALRANHNMLSNSNGNAENS